MLTCITCSKQRMEEEGGGVEGARGTPSTKEAVKSLTAQGQHVEFTGCTALLVGHNPTKTTLTWLTVTGFIFEITAKCCSNFPTNLFNYRRETLASRHNHSFCSSRRRKPHYSSDNYIASLYPSGKPGKREDTYGGKDASYCPCCDPPLNSCRPIVMQVFKTAKREGENASLSLPRK